MGDVGVLGKNKALALVDAEPGTRGSGRDLLFAVLNGTPADFTGGGGGASAAGAAAGGDTDAFAEVDDLLAAFDTPPASPGKSVENSGGGGQNKGRRKSNAQDNNKSRSSSGATRSTGNNKGNQSEETAQSARRLSRASSSQQSNTRRRRGGGAAAAGGAGGSRAKSHERTRTAVYMPVYGGGWGVSPGAPRLRTPKYGQALYHYLTKPLCPDAGRVQMYIIRDVDASRFNAARYTLYHEATKVPMIVAIHHSHAMYSTYDIKIVSTGRLDCGLGWFGLRFVLLWFVS
jgi:hypothetical protein